LSIFSYFFLLFFFSILLHSHMHLSATKLWRDNNKNFEHLSRGCPIGYFLDGYSQCKSKTFSGGFRWKNECVYSQCRNSAYVDGVYVILILRAWQTSHKASTKLNQTQCKASSI
jgi:hypothetical protein